MKTKKYERYEFTCLILIVHNIYKKINVSNYYAGLTSVSFHHMCSR